MELTSLKELYLEQLRDLYSAETQITAALPKMAAAASHDALKQGFEMHLEETKNQIKRLEKIFSDLKEDSGGHTCAAMQGLIKEGDEVVNATGDPAVKDAALIAAAQRVEHYEMAGYGTTRTFATHLGLNEHVELLQATLDEEGATDKKLTLLAEGGTFADGINEEAESA